MKFLVENPWMLEHPNRIPIEEAIAALEKQIFELQIHEFDCNKLAVTNKLKLLATCQYQIDTINSASIEHRYQIASSP